MMCDNCNRVYNTCQNQIRDLTKYQSVLGDYFNEDQQALELRWSIAEMRHFKELGDYVMTKSKRCNDACDYQIELVRQRIQSLMEHLALVTLLMEPDTQEQFTCMLMDYAVETIHAATGRA
jgi:hypothetical protein